MSIFSDSLAGMLDDANAETLRLIQTSAIEPDPDQPRKEFDREKLLQLADSLKNTGQIQPITVTEIEPGQYRLVTGERRWRAAQLAGLTQILARVYPVLDADRLIHQLVENEQRENMSAIDTARAIAELVKRVGSAVAAGHRISKSEAQISKYLAILNLPERTATLAASTKDVEVLTTIAKIERTDPKAAELLVKEAEGGRPLSRDKVRKIAKEVNEKLKTKKNMKRGSDRPPVGCASDLVRPIQLACGDAMRIRVNVKESELFRAAVAEYGDAYLLLDRVSPLSGHCWIGFGLAADSAPACTQHYLCSSIEIVDVGIIDSAKLKQLR